MNLNGYCLNCSESRDKVQHQVGQIYTVISIIKIKELAILPEMWANKSICSYSDFNLAYVAEFQYKAGYEKKKLGRYGNPRHIFFTNGIYFVQKINHLHNDRVANMWRNNVPSVCVRG